MIDFFAKLFSSDFMPHGHCYLWTPSILWMSAISDGVIALSYFAIPLILLHLVRKRPDFTYYWVLGFFALFILACGATHLIEIWTIWYGTYRVGAVMKVVTALLSVGTAILLWRLLPTILTVPSPRQLEEEIIERNRLNEELMRHEAELERVLEQAERQARIIADQMTTSLRDSERKAKKLALVASHTDDSILITDAAGKVEWVNDGFQRLTEFSLEEVVGTVPPFLRIAPNSLEDDFKPRIMEVCNTKFPQRCYSKSGRPYWVQIDVKPIHDERGAIANFIAIERDITDEIHLTDKLTEVNDLLSSIIEHLPIMLFIKDPANLTIQLWNKIAEKITGVRIGEILGKTGFEHFPLEQMEGFIARDRKVLEEKRPIETTEEIYTKSGDIRVLRTKKYPLYAADGKPRCLIGISEDITEEKRAEEKLRQAIADAECASRAKSEFLANMSHELRTPLNGVVGSLTLLQQSELTPAQQRYARMAKSSSKTLLALINDILDLSKIEAGRLELEDIPFDLRSVVDETIELFIPAADERGLRFGSKIDPNVTPTLRGDATRVQQILMNLVSNALKFTERGKIVVHVSQEPKGQLRIAVQDTGIGIAKHRQEKLFQSFSQVDSSTTRLYGGTGLGLAIAKRLVELMRGEIGVESEEGKGSTFWFALPAQHAEVPQENAPVVSTAEAPYPQPTLLTRSTPAHAAEEPTIAGKQILIVEDTIINQSVLAEFLSMWGCEYSIAQDGEQAVDKFHERGFDVILMDCQMPRMDGYEATRRIRIIEEERKAPCRTPIIALTANALKEDRKRCLDAGMDDYLAKPIEPETLQALLSKYCQAAAVPSAEKVQAKSSPENEPFQVNSMMRRCMNNKSIVLMMIEQFEQQALQNLDELHILDLSSDSRRVSEVAHALKGAAQLLDATTVTEFSKSIEEAARLGDLSRVREDLPRLDRAVNECVEFAAEARRLVEGA